MATETEFTDIIYAPDNHDMMETVWAELMAFFDLWGFWLAVGSAAMFVISLISIPLIVARIPADYFSGRQRVRLRQPAVEVIVLVLKNILGASLLLAGVIMLVTPGQGLMSILFGLMLMNYPGKYRLECWIIQRPMILHAINTMRKKRGKRPLLPPAA